MLVCLLVSLILLHNQEDIVTLISDLLLSKCMDIRENFVDIILALVLIISTLTLVMRLWQDLIVAAGRLS